MIHNVHERDLPVPADRLGALVDGVAERDNPLWPAPPWPPMRLDRPLGAGATGGHGPIRYHCVRHVPGREVEFAFDPAVGMEGTHTLAVLDGPSPGHSVLRHVLQGRPRSAWTVLRWAFMIRWLHDALLEDMLDNAARAVGHPPDRPARWSPWVRLVRAIMLPSTPQGSSVPTAR